MSSIYEGTDLQIETIDSKPYLLQARAVFPDGTAGEWGPSAFLPEYVAPEGSIGAFDGTFESYFVAPDVTNDKWVITNGPNFSPFSLDTSAQVTGNNSIKTTAASHSAADSFTITTPAFDVYGDTIIKWSLHAKTSVSGALNFSVNAYWVNDASVVPTTGSNLITVFANDPVAIDYVQSGQIKVPAGAERMIVVYNFKTVSGATYPVNLWIDDLILAGVIQEPIDSTTDQVIYGSKYFKSLAADDARFETASMYQADAEMMTARSIDSVEITKNGVDVAVSGKNILYTGDYPRLNTDRPGIPTAAVGPNSETLNSMSIYPRDISLTNQYLATIIWSGWIRVHDSDANSDATLYNGRVEFVIDQQTDPASGWTEMRRLQTNGSIPAATLIHHRVINTPYYAVRVRVENVGSVKIWAEFPNNKNANSLRIKLEDAPKPPALSEDQPHSFRPPGLSYSTGGNDAPDGGVGAQLYRKTGSWSGRFGWKESYKGNGDRRNDSDHLFQGYFADQYGNQKSALGNISWTVNGTPPVDAYGFRVTSCKFLFNPLSWYNNNGTLVVGTHTSSSTTIPTTWGSIGGKDDDRQRIDVRANNTVLTRDIGSVIGNELYNGTAKGILLGPGPTASKNWWGSFASGMYGPTSLATALPEQIRIEYEWYQTTP